MNGHSGTFPHGRLLEEMHHHPNPQQQVGEERGDVRAELRGQVLGCEFYGYQTFGEDEGAGAVE